MTLGTHAIVGGSLAVLASADPVATFCLGFLSHFVLDSIPHYDYPLLSLYQNVDDKLDVGMNFGRLFLLDILRIGADFGIGLLVLFMFYGDRPSFPYIILAGAFGAVLPDGLQFAYFKLKKAPLRAPLRLLQRFHLFIHAESNLNNRPVFGIFCQVLVVAAFLSISFLVIQ